MHEQSFLAALGVALVAALVGGLLARAVRLPVLIGYLGAGILIGPHTPGIFAHPEPVGHVAELGVALLMFALGVHVSLKDLMRMWRTSVVGGALQIGGTIVLGVLAGLSFGWGLYGGLYLGCALALSSTAVMMKILEQRGELGTTHGNVLLGILVVQDFSLILMAILLPAMASFSQGGTEAFTGMAMALLRAGLFVGGTIVLSVRVVPSLMHLMARSGSRELFLLGVVCLCLSASMAAKMAGLGMELGAFLAGLVISETDYAHEVFAQVRPLRDVFASLFFVSVGMLLDPGFVIGHWGAVLAVVVVILVGKSLVSVLSIYLLGWHGRTAILAGIGLGQIGEFSFVLATIGSSKDLIPGVISNVILSAALATLLLSPFLYQSADSIYNRLNSYPWLSRWLNRQKTEVVTLSAASSDRTPKPRAALLGYGRVGKYVSNALRTKGVVHQVVEYDADAILRLKKEGIPAVYGDAASPTVLQQVVNEDLELAIIALPESSTTEMAIRTLRKLSPTLQIVVRVHGGLDIHRMRLAGADAVIHAEFEAGTEMIRQGLSRLGISNANLDTYIEKERQHRYREE